ncbi:MAG: hypothetical protein AAF962_27285 [Actinomycetota bacterium]
MLVVVLVGVGVIGCGQAPQVLDGEGWRWLAVSADQSETFLRPLTSQDELEAFWEGAAAGMPPIDAPLPVVDFDREFVLVLSTRGRGIEPVPCGVYFRGLSTDDRSGEVTVNFEPDRSADACDSLYVFGQYVIAVAWDFTGPPPFELLIDEPGQAGQPDAVSVRR